MTKNTTQNQNQTKDNHAANVALLQADLRLATGYYYHFYLGRPTLPDWFDHNNQAHVVQFIRTTDMMGTVAVYSQFVAAGGDLESARGQQVTNMLDTAYRGFNPSEYTSMPFQEFLVKLEQGDVEGTILDANIAEAEAAIDYLESVQGVCGYGSPDYVYGLDGSAPA